MAILTLLFGCDRLSERNLMLQEQCAEQAQLEFARDGFGAERTAKYAFIDHYNPSLNKCFIEEYVYNTSSDVGSRYSSIFVSDVYEHKRYGSFASPLQKGGESPDCTVMMPGGAKVNCKSEEEFNKLVKPYME